MTKREYPLNAVRVCIDSFDGEIKGRIYSRLLKECMVFHNTVQLLLQTDAFLDASGYPQAFQIKRRFTDRNPRSDRHTLTGPILEDAEIRRARGALGTLDIINNSRRRTNWQGYVRTHEREAVPYKSEMELLRQVWSVLQEEKVS